MHTLDLLGTQTPEARPSSLNVRNEKRSSDESSFQKYFDKEVNSQERQAPHRPDDKPSKHAAADRNESSRAQTDEGQGVTQNDSLPVDEGNTGTKTDSALAVDSKQGVGLDSSGDQSDQFVAAPLHLHIEQDGLPSQRYFEQIVPLGQLADELTEFDLALVPVPVAFQTKAPVTEPLGTNAADDVVDPRLVSMGAFKAQTSELHPLTQNAINASAISQPKPVVPAEQGAATQSPTVGVKAQSLGLIKQGSMQSSSPTSFSLTPELISSSSERLPEIPVQMSAAAAITEKAPGLDLANSATQNARFTVNVQFGRAEWNAGVAAKVAQMAAQNLNYAEIQLDPPELGPLQVRVQVNSDQASVVFNAHSAQVREALEQGSQRLRELFESEGLNLVDVDVSDQQQQSEQDELESEHTGETHLASETSSEEAELAAEQTISAEIQVGVDDFV